jgi:hypothetical protein
VIEPFTKDVDRLIKMGKKYVIRIVMGTAVRHDNVGFILIYHALNSPGIQFIVAMPKDCGFGGTTLKFFEYFSTDGWDGSKEISLKTKGDLSRPD